MALAIPSEYGTGVHWNRITTPLTSEDPRQYFQSSWNISQSGGFCYLISTKISQTTPLSAVLWKLWASSLNHRTLEYPWHYPSWSRVPWVVGHYLSTTGPSIGLHPLLTPKPLPFSQKPWSPYLNKVHVLAPFRLFKPFQYILEN